MALELYLIRHPSTVANNGRVIQGDGESPLIDGWEESVQTLAEELALEGRFRAFFASDLTRNYLPANLAVAHIVNRQKHPLVYHTMSELRERNWGVFKGRSYDSIDTGGEPLPQYLYKLKTIENGESLHEIRERIVKVYRHLLLHEGRVGIMGHLYPLNYLVSFALADGDIIGVPFMEWPNLKIERHEFDDAKILSLKRLVGIS